MKNQLYEFSRILSFIDATSTGQAGNNGSNQRRWFDWVTDVQQGTYPQIPGVWFGGFSGNVAELKAMAKSVGTRAVEKENEEQ